MKIFTFKEKRERNSHISAGSTRDELAKFNDSRKAEKRNDVKRRRPPALFRQTKCNADAYCKLVHEV